MLRLEFELQRRWRSRDPSPDPLGLVFERLSWIYQKVIQATRDGLACFREGFENACEVVSDTIDRLLCGTSQSLVLAFCAVGAAA